MLVIGRVAFGAAAEDLTGPPAQAVGATRDPDSKGLYPRQPAYSEAHAARFASGLERQVSYALLQAVTQALVGAAGAGVAEVPVVAAFEQAVTSARVPDSKGLNPRQPA